MDSIKFVSYEPDYNSQCSNCDQTPVVNLIDGKGKVVHTTEMCGPCTWGEARTLDPDTWNEDIS